MAADATRQVQDKDLATVVEDNDHQVNVPPGLVPFRKGDARASEAGRKGGEARRARRTAAMASARAASAGLVEVRARFDREELGPNAAAGASWLVGQVVAGRIPVRNGDEAASLLRALVDVARLEAGESTSNTLVAHVGAGAAAEIRALRDQARQALGQVVDVDEVNDPA